MIDFDDVVHYMLIILIVLFVIFIIIILVDVQFILKSKGQACKDIGYKEYETMGDFRYCQDHIGNLYYAHFECDGFLHARECKANLISVGDVRVVSGG